MIAWPLEEGGGEKFYCSDSFYCYDNAFISRLNPSIISMYPRSLIRISLSMALTSFILESLTWI